MIISMPNFEMIGTVGTNLSSVFLASVGKWGSTPPPQSPFARLCDLSCERIQFNPTRDATIPFVCDLTDQFQHIRK